VLQRMGYGLLQADAQQYDVLARISEIVGSSAYSPIVRSF
jgi:hypothetical protein